MKKVDNYLKKLENRSRVIFKFLLYMKYKNFTIFATTCFFVLTSFATDLPKGIRHVKTVGDIEAYELESNGLRILLQQNEGFPIATVMVTYKVGGRNEVTGTTGATHILEHMMFKGTKANSGANSYSRRMERIGARSNATTYYDRTNYYAMLPSEYINKAIELEADRMRNLQITSEALESEITVVLNEYQRGENNPIATLIKEMFATAFMAHPYGQPVIGWKSDIENTSPEKLRKFYNTFYWPENATLTVIGGFDKESTLAAIHKYYDSIPKASHEIPVLETLEPKQLGPRRTTIERPGRIGLVAISYKTPAGTHKDWASLQLISQILGADKTGRLYRALDDKGKASATFAEAPQLRDPGLFFFGAFLTPDSTHEEVERIILDEIARVSRVSITEEELARAKSVIEAQTVYNRDGLYKVAHEINEYIAMGDWASYITQPQNIQRVTVEDIQRVIKTYFTTNNRTTGWYVPVKTATTTDPFSQFGPRYFRDPKIFDLKHGMTTQPFIPSDNNTGAVHFGEHIQQTKVGNIEVVAIDLPIDNVVSFVGSFAAGETLNPKGRPALAGLTASMLDKGTKHRSRFTIAEQLDTLGASVRFNADKHSLSFSGKFLRKDAGSIINLLAEQLKEPDFDPEVFENLKSRQKAEQLLAIHDPNYRAGSEVSRLLYPKDHPNYKYPIETLLMDLEATTVEDIKAFHQDHYGSKSMRLVFAGDIDFNQLTAAIESAFADWSGGVAYPSESVRPAAKKAQSKRIFIKDKPSVSAYFAQFTNLQRTDDDYLPFSVGNHILGGSFHSRLMSEVRERQGLTYHIASTHQGDTLTPGNWTVNGSFAPSMLDKGLKTTKAVLEDWYRTGVSEDEVRATLTTLRGSYLVRLSTTATVAGQVHDFMQRGFPANYIDLYPSLLTRITAKDVNTAIRKYLDLEKMTLVVAGSLKNSMETEQISPTDTQN